MAHFSHLATPKALDEISSLPNTRSPAIPTPENAHSPADSGNRPPSPIYSPSYRNLRSRQRHVSRVALPSASTLCRNDANKSAHDASWETGGASDGSVDPPSMLPLINTSRPSSRETRQQSALLIWQKMQSAAGQNNNLVIS